MGSTRKWYCLASKKISKLPNFLTLYWLCPVVILRSCAIHSSNLFSSKVLLTGLSYEALRRLMEDKGKGNERWSGAIANLTETSLNLQSLQKLLLKKAVFVDEETFAKASLSSEQARTIKVLEQRVETLERELDAAISAAARARSEQRQAEAGQKAAELRAQEITKELENTTKVFELHMEELRAKQEEIAKRDNEIKLLEAIIQTLGGSGSHSKSG